ncbi:MAG: thiamine pyrophosphate-binding protein [Chloroflexi bacterium]|nr:thiamine pyrophosphate-binding protein [Chloroflexota bacterium]MDA1296524.1 thiamine pyrophosphate-binding protein [Chloroflexota bacterium]
MAKVTGSDLLIRALKAEGVDTVFGIAGDHILHMLDKMHDEEFRMIDFRHESAAVHAADSYSRILRRGAVTLSTTPGHANAVPALANAIHSEAPVVNISGSADSSNLGRGAMQEFDQVGVARPVTKGAWEVPSPERIPEFVALAFRTALAGRQGPVHLTIPHDYQSAEVDEAAAARYAPHEYSTPRRVLGDPAQVQRAVELLRNASRPIIMAGSSAGATADPAVLQKFVERTHIPFVSEDSARALIPDSHEYSVGLGYQPLNRAAQRIREADVVLMLGKRLDYTLGFGGSPPFADGVRHIVVDPSPAEIGRARTVEVGILGDVGPIIEQLADEASKHTWDRHADWMDSLQRDHDRWMEELHELASSANPIHPMSVSESLQKFIDDDTHISYDGGDYCHFLRASIKRDRPFRFHNVSSFGMIGVGLPYALGAQVALPGKQVVLSVGDGSFGFNGMEIDTMVRHNLPVKMVLGNNSIWGIDWQIQKGLYGRPVWTDLLPTRYDQVAQGLGAHGEHVTSFEQLEPALRRAFEYDGPALVNIEIAQVISPVAEAAISRKLGSHG